MVTMMDSVLWGVDSRDALMARSNVNIDNIQGEDSTLYSWWAWQQSLFSVTLFCFDASGQYKIIGINIY